MQIVQVQIHSADSASGVVRNGEKNLNHLFYCMDVFLCGTAARIHVSMSVSQFDIFR